MSVNFENIIDATKKLNGNIKKTPIVRASKLSEKLGCDLYLKLESLQLTSSFKTRGSFIAIKKICEQSPGKGVIAMSAGNHAQAVAYHAKNLNVPATIIMPEQAPFSKIERTKELGAEVILRGRTLNETSEYVNELSKVKNLSLIHPYNNVDVINGQGSIGIEFFDEIKDLDCFLVPIGGGGLISGISTALKKLQPRIKIFGIESNLYPSTFNKFNNKQLPCLGDTIADGIAVKSPGELTYPIIKQLVNDVFLVDEISIEHSISCLFEEERIISEGAGAVGVAAILSNKDYFKNKKVGTVICGGNIDSRIFAEILNKQLSRDGKLARIRIGITDEPGMLAKISNAIAKNGGNIIEIYHQRMFHDVPVKKAKIDAIIEAKNTSNIDEIINTLKCDNFEVSILNENSS